MTATDSPVPGSLVRVAGLRGWFKVKGVFERDGSVTAFGPCFKNGCPMPRAKMRAFYPGVIAADQRRAGELAAERRAS